MISLYGLFILLLTAEAIHAQGDTDDDDDDGDFDKTFDSNPKYRKIPRFLQGSRSMDRHSLLKGDDIPNQSGASSSTGSKSKKADRFLQRLRSMNKYKPFQENDISDESGASSSTGSKSKKIGRFLREPRSMDQYGLLQGDDISDESDTSSSTDLKSRKRRKGSVWEESPSKSPPQQQSLPVSQPSTSYDPPQSDEILLPRYMGKKEAESYLQSHNPEQYSAFIEDETKYFILTYSLKKILGEGGYGAVYLATKKSDGMEVACKSIPRQNVYYYALELKPPPRCNLRNPLVGSDEQSVEQCMSPRPSGLYVAHEAILQMYLSQPGNASPYVARALDYITLQDRFMLIMEYLGKSWMTLFSYMKERIRLDIKDACNIIKEVINAVIDLKQHGVFHKNIHIGNVLYNKETGRVKLTGFGVTDVISGWREKRLLQLKSSDPPSTFPEYEAEPSELRVICTIGQLLSNLLTGQRVYKHFFNYGKLMRETILPDPDPSQSELKEKAIHLVNILVSLDPKQMPSLEAILGHSFFD